MKWGGGGKRVFWGPITVSIPSGVNPLGLLFLIAECPQSSTRTIRPARSTLGDAPGASFSATLESGTNENFFGIAQTATEVPQKPFSIDTADRRGQT